jgi:hypothetical protein
MSRPMYSPSTLPVQPRPDPLLLFIQQAQLTLLNRERSSESGSTSLGMPALRPNGPRISCGDF